MPNSRYGENSEVPTRAFSAWVSENVKQSNYAKSVHVLHVISMISIR